MKREYMLLGGASVVSLGLGAVAGFLFAKKQLETKYEEISRQEIAEAKLFYNVLYKKNDFETPESAVESLGLTEAAEALQRYQGIVKDVDEETVETIDTVDNDVDDASTDDQLDNDFDYEEELKNRSSDTPYVISHDEFMEADKDYAQSTLTYYEGDDVLTDDRDKPIDQVESTIGEDNLLRFGHGSKDNKIVYIRNERIDVDFEVVQSQGKYVEEVLGFIEHSAHRKTRRSRSDDE